MDIKNENVRPLFSKYRVAAMCWEPDEKDSMDERIYKLTEKLSLLIDHLSPDMVVLPEVCLVHGLMPAKSAETIDGPSCKAISRISATRSVNICLPLLEDDGGRIFNTAVYFDRNGEIAGKYRKQVPTPGEIERGIQPGNRDQKNVIIDGFRIATAICFDENFPDIIWDFILQGTDIIVFPAYTYAGKLMEAWAVNCGVPLICAFPWESVIYDRDGTLLCKGGTWTSTIKLGHHPEWIVSSLNMQSRIYHLDGNQEHLPGIYERYGNEIDIKLMVKEARMLITVNSDKTSISDIEEETPLIPLQTYLSESRAKASG